MFISPESLSCNNLEKKFNHSFHGYVLFSFTFVGDTPKYHSLN
jgi:hypothetical protein